MTLFTPSQILSQIENTLTTQQYIKAAEYIANNIEEINIRINEALNTNANSISLDIPGISQS